jgi:tetratricopeptide (TPR) repeat protein
MKYILTLVLLFGNFALQAQSGDALKDSVEKYEKQKQFKKVIPFAEQWVEKLKKDKKESSAEYGAALNALGYALNRSGKSKEAEPILLQGLEIRKKVLGPEHPDVAASLNNLGDFYEDMGNYAKAEPYYLQALEIRKKALGLEHPDVAASLNSLGILYWVMGNYAKAEPYYQQALEIRKKVRGPEYPDVASSLNNLGALYVNMGNYAKAEPYYQQALEIRKKAVGPEHPLMGNSLNNLGILYHEMGDYPKAEPYYQQALEIRQKALGPEHPLVGDAFNNLGVLYMDLGDYTKAEPYIQQALEIRKKALGPEHPDVAASLNNLGILYRNMCDYAKAEPYYLQALEIRKKALGPEHPDVAASLNNLGILYSDMGDYAKAETYYHQALEILKKALGPEHPDVASSLNNLGALYVNMGDYAKAEPYYLQILEIRKKALGLEHPDVVAYSLNYLGNLYRVEQKRLPAKQNFNQVADLNRKLIVRYFPSMSEQGREAFLKKGVGDREGLLSFWSEEGGNMPELRGELWNHQLFYKGLLLNTSARWKQRIKTSGDMKLVLRLNDWENLQHKISKLFTSTDSTERASLDSLVDKAEKLEKELSQRSENFARSEERKVRSWQEVQQALKPGEAAIEMVRFRHFGIAKVVTDTSNSKKPTYRVKGLTDTIQYAALILTKTSTQPELVILPNGNYLEGKWHKYYRNSVRLQQKDAESYKQYWQPIARKLKGIKKVWFSADGVYHKLNLGTLQNPATGKYLMDELEIALLGSTKDLLKKYPEENENRLACLVGNPEFQPGQAAMAGKSRSGPELSYYFKPDPNLEVAALPGTQQEIDGVAGILGKQGWEVQEYAGAEASEEKVKDSYKPRVMLLSTHGFFRSDTTLGSNPLLRSGLLLSGAAKTLREGRSGEGEDGILTAYEAMNLNLDNTELVVLSACETGLGEVKNGEGVYGLQRAFQVAGARNLIMSLWKVDDAVTKELMLAFFRNWLGNDGKGELQFAPKSSDALRTAFRKAQLEIRRKHPEPYYWGGFVLLGK